MLKVELGGEFVAELTLFELWSGGHTPNYIRWLVEAWQSQGPGTLRAIITNRFLKQHEYVFRDLLNVPGSVIRWTAIDDADEVAIEAARTRAQAVDSASGKASETAGDDTLLSLYWTLLQKYGRKFPSRLTACLPKVTSAWQPKCSGQRQAKRNQARLLFLLGMHLS